MTAFICSILYIVIVIAIGYFTSKKNDSTEKYFAAERSMTWPLIGMMLFAFIFAGPAVTGPLESGYDYGIECMWACMGMAIGCLWFIVGGVSNLYRVSGRHGAMSVPGVFAYRFDEKTRLMMMVYISIVFTMFFTTQISAIGSLFSGLLNTSYFPMALFITVCFVAMAWFGFEGVAWQNVLHNIMMVVGFGVMLYLCVDAAGGFGVMWEELPATHWDPWYPNLNISGSDLLSAVFQCAVSGTIVTCAFVAKNRKHTALGFTFGLALAAIYSLFGPLIGMAARIMYGDGVDPTLIPSMVTTEFGTIPGILLNIGILAATASTAPGLLMVVVNALVNDLYPAVKKDVTDKQKMFLTRILLFVVAAVALWLSSSFASNLLGYLFLAFAINSCAGVILWLSHFIPRLNANCAFWGMLVGIVAVFGWQFFGDPDYIAPFWFSMVGVVVCLIMCLFQKGADPKYIAYRQELKYLKENPDKEFEEYLQSLEKANQSAGEQGA